MDGDLTSIITLVLNQAPQWIRADLASKEPALRERAEEALAAMIAAAVAAAEQLTFSPPSPH
jgi:hypothetical protein